ncbi:MAG: 4-hydroxy-3-methylbut-2-en-1-yl diphosphate synthase, partial [Limnohabitans sp.]
MSSDRFESHLGAPPQCEGIPLSQPKARRSLQARVRWLDHVVTVGGDAPVRVQSMTNT